MQDVPQSAGLASSAPVAVGAFQSATHGWHGLALVYGLTLIGLLAGYLWMRAGMVRMIRAPLLAIPVCIVAEMLLAMLHSVLPLSSAGLLGVIFALLQLALLPGFGFLAAIVLAHAGRGQRLLRGTVVSDGHSRRRSGGSGGLTLAGEPVAAEDETKHFKLIGTTGTGKSTAIRELLKGALARGDRAVIADPDGSYLKLFYQPERGDVILSPFDGRAARWDLFAEIELAQDADQLARALIPDYDGDDRIWRNYGRTLLTALFRQFHRVGEARLDRLFRLISNAPVEELRDLLGDSPAAPFLGKDNGKFFESVRSVTVTHVAGLEHLARQKSGEPFSIRRWIRGGAGGRGVLFLPYRANEMASLRPLISTWMRLAIFEALAAEEGDQKLWFVIDELDALGAIDGLKDALARLRKFGGRCVLGFQSIAQVRGTQGDTEAQTIVENCGNTLILRCSASERGGTAEFAARLIGRREIVRRQVSRSRPVGFMSSTPATRTVSEQHVTEEAVMASEIEQLEDLSGFLKLASKSAWLRVRMERPQ
jgi:type IV secretory pathway TraG/TraD family ATPase VirD4